MISCRAGRAIVRTLSAALFAQIYKPKGGSSPKLVSDPMPNYNWIKWNNQKAVRVMSDGIVIPQTKARGVFSMFSSLPILVSLCRRMSYASLHHVSSLSMQA